MEVKELKDKAEFYIDAIFQAGYDRGWDAALAELDCLSDNEWNKGNKLVAEVIRKFINKVRGENEDITMA